MPHALNSMPTGLKTGADDEGGYVVSGRKTFVTCAREAQVLFVAAKEGEDSKGRPRLRLVQLTPDTAGMGGRAFANSCA